MLAVLLGLACVAAVLSGCQPSKGAGHAPQVDSGADGSVDATDAPADVGNGIGSDAPGPVCDASPYGPGFVCWTACQESVPDWCASGGDCMAWPADVTAFCSVYPPGKVGSLQSADTCGAYHVLRADGADFGTSYYFDAVKGKLLAAVFHDYVQGIATCIAGAPDFVEPDCHSAAFQTVPCADGGAGGADSGAAGAPDAAP